ncbi:cytokinin riboside 5'-monophosphate phosphoribohydrolase [Persicitalea jodogahamensis]|uniref:Cytokinin riboside 5'-monophosphate phosphoribohydrolase n=2 Tax=Persicitalea jodogahamensis TaxID=402147 RepID=A0A8J3D0F9_9BACT|nr:cytokinin riboside 5'-monophosphate phosphoribohydrolase [Persicitalea jodogahamensis]
MRKFGAIIKHHPMKSIVVYCGSNPGKNPLYAQTAYALGQHLALNSINVVYGGGNLGLMGRVADGALEEGGTVTGIIPNFLAKLEVSHKTLTELEFVDTMHERKARMVSLSDGVIVLPGGYGTMDELFEILAWSQLRLFHGPVGVLNTNGFYDHLIAHTDMMVEEGFLRPENRELMLVAETVEELLEKMSEFFQNKAENKELDQTLYVEK